MVKGEIEYLVPNPVTASGTSPLQFTNRESVQLVGSPEGERVTVRAIY